MLTALTALFFLSGFSALVYEIALVRVLSYSFGHTFYAVSTILTTYMSGLALGSHVFGKISDDRPERGLRTYAWLEGGIALYALPVAFFWGPVTKWLEAWVGTTFDPSFGTSVAIKFAIIAILLVPLTFLMGATLPVVSRYATRHLEQMGKSIGTLYGQNTLGGVLGAFLAGFFLIPALGIRGTMLVAVAVNAVVCTCALALARRSPLGPFPATSGPVGDSSAPGPLSAPSLGLARVVPAIAFLTGLASLGSEVVWTRVFSALVAPTPYVFTTILVAFLGGLGIGSLLTAERFARSDQRRLLGLASAALFASGILVLALYPALPGIAKLLNRIEDPSGPTQGAWLRWAGARFMVVFAPVFFTTTIFGMVLPILIRARVTRLDLMGRSVGDVVAVNTLGAIVGSFVTGFVLLPRLGSSNTSALMGGTILACSVLLAAAISARVLALALLAASTTALVLAARTPLYHFASYYGDVPTVEAVGDASFMTPLGVESRIVFNKEDPTSTVSVLELPSGNRVLFVEGLITASDSRGVFWNLALKGHLPLLFHPAPRDVLVIGLGAGITLGAIAQHDVETITVVELSPAVIEAQDLFARGNFRAHTRPNVKIIENDGRDFLLTTPKRYDVITVDQTDPPVMMLYSKDFYVDAKRRLRPDGIFLQWVPLYHLSDRSLLSIVQAFREAFPSVSIWNGKECIFLVGTNGNLEIRLSTMQERLRNPRIKASLARFGADDEATLLALFLAGDAEVNHLLERRYANGIATSDDRPIIEFNVPKERFLRAAGSLRKLVGEEIGDVRDVLVPEGTSGAEETRGVDFPKVSRALLWMSPAIAEAISEGKVGPEELEMNDREFEIARRFSQNGAAPG